MITIYKYTLSKYGEVLAMPEGAEILCVQSQNNSICLWAQINTSEISTCFRNFNCLGTGWEIENIDSLKYIGTVQLDEDTLVLHVFEEV